MSRTVVDGVLYQANPRLLWAFIRWSGASRKDGVAVMCNQRPSKRGPSKMITTVINLLPVAALILEEVTDAQAAPVAIIAARVTLRTGILMCARKRAG